MSPVCLTQLQYRKSVACIRLVLSPKQYSLPLDRVYPMLSRLMSVRIPKPKSAQNHPNAYENATQNSRHQN